MSDLIVAIQRAADTPLAGHTPKRRGMDEATARRVCAVVVDAVEALALELKVDRAWGSDVFLRKLRAMKGDGQ